MSINEQQQLSVLVLAGRRGGESDQIARDAGVSCKAFARVAGQPMIERVLGVLLDHPGIGRIEVALPAESPVDREASRLAEWLGAGRVHATEALASPARTVSAALSSLRDGRHLLITTADHVLLSGAVLDSFLAGCEPAGVDAFAGLLALDVLESKYPGMKRTGIRLRDGRYSGCNLFLLRAGAGARSLVAFWRTLESLRKSPWRMARAVGPVVLVRYGLRLLTLREALARTGARAGAELAPVILDIPEAAIDVDTPGDLKFAEKLLGRNV